MRMLVDHFMCRDGRSEDAARRNYQTALGTLLIFFKDHALPLVEDVEIDGALVACSNHCFVQGVQHHHGSQLLTAVMVRWPSFSRFGSRVLLRFHRCLKEWRQLTPARTRRAMPAPVWEGIAAHLALLNHLHNSVHSHPAGDLHAAVRASSIEKERSCLTACATSPVLVDRDRGFRNWSVYQNWNPRRGYVGKATTSPARKRLIGKIYA